MYILNIYYIYKILNHFIYIMQIRISIKMLTYSEVMRSKSPAMQIVRD